MVEVEPDILQVKGCKPKDAVAVLIPWITPLAKKPFWLLSWQSSAGVAVLGLDLVGWQREFDQIVLAQVLLLE